MKYLPGATAKVFVVVAIDELFVAVILCEEYVHCLVFIVEIVSEIFVHSVQWQLVKYLWLLLPVKFLIIVLYLFKIFYVMNLFIVLYLWLKLYLKYLFILYNGYW